MKRTPLKRRTRLRCRRPGRRRGQAQRVCPGYRAWIRTLPCLVRGRTPLVDAVDGFTTRTWGGHACDSASQAAHVRGRRTNPDRGNLVPLCRLAHIEQLHRWGAKTFQARYGINLTAAARALDLEYDGLPDDSSPWNEG